MNPTHATVVGLRNAIASRKTTATEATRAYLDRINRHDKALHAYHEIYEQRSLQRTADVDEGKITGPLAGVPIAIKDVLCTDWGKTTCGSKMLEQYHSPFTATSVKKLEDAGAIVIGKTICDEFAMGSSTENSAFGPSKNPWDPSRVPGGSSGGSAVAVAADLCAGSLGTDTGGSIRQPAALCGIVGIKPTYGRISRWGLVAFASSLDQVGPFAHSVEDVALLLQAVAGHDPLDSTSADVPVPDYDSELKSPITGVRIGLPKQALSDANDPAVAAALSQAIEVYKSQGATIVDIDLPHTDYGIPTYYVVATAEASSNLARYDGVHYGHRTAHATDLIDLYARSRAEGFGPEVKRRIMLGTYALSKGYGEKFYLKALQVRRLIKRDFDQAFARCDAVLMPTTPNPAFRFGEKTSDPLAMYLEDVYTVNCNLAGLPGISLPAGFAERDGRRIPVGIQLLGKWFNESRLLRIARLFEQATEHAKARPALT